MNVAAAAAYLTERGYKCSAATVRALAHAGRLRCYRPGVTGKGPMEFTPQRLDELLRDAESKGIDADAPPADPLPAKAPAPPKRSASPRPKVGLDPGKFDWQKRLEESKRGLS